MKAKLTKVLSLVLVVIMAMGLMTGCSTSVSYTHLDVYKRQECGR